MATPNALDLATQAARGFKLYECEECAQRIIEALTAAGQPGQRIAIRGAYGSDFMVCLSYDGGRSTVTRTGKHVGIRVGDVIFDNLHPAGLPYDRWLADFDALGGIEVQETSNF